MSWETKKDSDKHLHFWSSSKEWPPDSHMNTSFWQCLRFILFREGFSSHWEFQRDDYRHLNVVQTGILDGGQTVGISRQTKYDHFIGHQSSRQWNKCNSSMGGFDLPKWKYAFICLFCWETERNFKEYYEVLCRFTRVMINCYCCFCKNISLWVMFTTH